MKALRLTLFALTLVAMMTSCAECPEPPVTEAAEPDWQPPTGPPRPPTDGLPDELRPPG